MTTDELRDWHARRAGWEQRPLEAWELDFGQGLGLSQEDHPFPATIDGAASAMPPGWGWWLVSAEWVAQGVSTPFVRVTDTGDEIHDRYALARLAWEATLPDQTSLT